jgi:hypothetical protein
MANHFSSLLTSEELALVPAQWRQLKRLISSKYRMRSYQDVYSQLISTRMDDENLGAVVKLIHISFFVVLSSVVCECGFRDMNIIKNDLRGCTSPDGAAQRHHDGLQKWSQASDGCMPLCHFEGGAVVSGLQRRKIRSRTFVKTKLADGK